ncbi:hypothetical protein [Streptodolium elevatio]|uniref:Uncharacterized protein n=1 Tax=Streptodolium elevatio TaxID=3157996 RepID=A0ABV3DMV0_9ACTN
MTAAAAAPAVPAPVLSLRFPLTPRRAEVARALLAYVAGLPLRSVDAQLLALLVAVRSAVTGTGHVTRAGLRSLQLGDRAAAVAALRGLGWEVPDALLGDDLEVPAAVTVSDWAQADGRPVDCSKTARAGVSSWMGGVLNTSPVAALAPPARLTALFLAAHASAEPESPDPLPDLLPGSCRSAVPDLLDSGFLADAAGGTYLLAPAVRHLAVALPRPRTPAWTPPAMDANDWRYWKDQRSPALRSHVDAVQHCALCAMPWEQVASAFTEAVQDPCRPSDNLRTAYGIWKRAHPDRGPQAAAFTVAFRAQHGHGPSIRQLCTGLGWEMWPPLRLLVVRRLLADGWLADTAPVPWTLRPGPAANAHGIALPRQRVPPTTRPTEERPLPR